MTEEVGNIDTGTELQQDQSTETVADSTPTSSQPPASEYISKTRVNEIVHERTKAVSQKAYERGRQEALATQQRERESQGHTQEPQQVSMGGMPQMTQDQLRKMMADVYTEQQGRQQQEFEKQRVQQEVQNLASSFMGKLSAAKDKYPGLDARREEISEMSPLVAYINETDEPAGVTQHLLDNGHNFASLLVLSQTSPNRLRSELKRLSDSIKNNDAARRIPDVNEPLHQPSPSHNAMDSASGSIESLKNQPWLKV